MGLISTHVDRSERLDKGRRIFTDVIHMKAIASYKDGSLRRDPMRLSATGSADWPLAVDGICDVRVNPRIAGKSPVLHVGHGRDFVRFALVGANNVSGVCKRNVTTFTNAWPNADLRYTYGGQRLQEDILLRSKHPRSFGFILREHTGFDPVTMTVGSLRIQQPSLEKGDVTVPLSWLVTQQGGKWLLTCVLPEGDWAGWTVDPTLTLQPDATDGVDTYAVPGGLAVTYNYGVATTRFQRGYNADKLLVRWNLSSVPVGALSTSVTAYFYGADTWTNSAKLQLFPIASANGNWVEGTKNHALAGAGEPCWDALAADGAGGVTTAWAGSAGLSTAGVDYGSLMAERTGSGALGQELVFSFTDPTSINAWFGVSVNPGVLIFATGYWAMNAWLCTSDHATAAYRPKLVIDYTLPGGGIFASSIFHSAIHGQNLTR